MATTPLNPYNYVTILVNGVPTVVAKTANQQLPAGTVQVTNNAEIPAVSLASPPARVSTQIKSVIPNITPGAN